MNAVEALAAFSGRLVLLSRDTYGGLPLVGPITFAQLALLGWVLRQVALARVERGSVADTAERRTRAALRAEIWRRSVRPVVMTLMLLGPGVGLSASTLLGAFGMGALGEAMTGAGGQDVLLESIGHAYREISYAYLLMVVGTAPMLIGPIIVLLARRLEDEAALACGGDREDLVLHALGRILTAIEALDAQAASDAVRTQALLERVFLAARAAPEARSLGDAPPRDAAKRASP